MPRACLEPDQGLLGAQILIRAEDSESSDDREHRLQDALICSLFVVQSSNWLVVVLARAIAYLWAQ